LFVSENDENRKKRKILNFEMLFFHTHMDNIFTLRNVFTVSRLFSAARYVLKIMAPSVTSTIPSKKLISIWTNIPITAHTITQSFEAHSALRDTSQCTLTGTQLYNKTNGV
jgi:hypothetical protein